MVKVAQKCESSHGASQYKPNRSKSTTRTFERGSVFVASCPMLITHAHMQQSQQLQQQSSSQRVGALSLIPSCLGISGHPSGSWQRHPRCAGARSAGRPWVARTQFSTAVQCCRNTANNCSSFLQQVFFFFCQTRTSPPLDQIALDRLRGHSLKLGGLWGRQGSHTMTPEKPKRALWVVHGLESRPQFHEKTPRERQEKNEHCGSREKTKSEILGPPTLRGPTLWAHFSWNGASPSFFILFLFIYVHFSFLYVLPFFRFFIPPLSLPPPNLKLVWGFGEVVTLLPFPSPSLLPLHPSRPSQT